MADIHIDLQLMVAPMWHVQQTRNACSSELFVSLCGLGWLVGHTCGPSLPGTSIVMLLPLSKIWSSLVMRRPSAVSSLQALERYAGVHTVCAAHVAINLQLCDILQYHVWFES